MLIGYLKVRSQMQLCNVGSAPPTDWGMLRDCWHVTRSHSGFCMWQHYSGHGIPLEILGRLVIMVFRDILYTLELSRGDVHHTCVRSGT